MKVTITLDLVDDPEKLDNTIKTLTTLASNPSLWKDEPAAVRDCATLWTVIRDQMNLQREVPPE